MLTNKVTMDLELPVEVNEEGLAILHAQAAFIAKFWLGAIAEFKNKGLAVPVLSVKNVKPQVSDEQKEFNRTLLEHHLKYAPKANVAPQVKVIKELYGLGGTVDEYLKLYEKSREEYPMTSWLTVKYKLNQANKGADVATELSEQEVSSIKERYAPKEDNEG